MIADFSLMTRAAGLAQTLHRFQKRKYTDESYALHLAEVASLTAAVAPRDKMAVMVATAWLHDCIEDQGITERQLLEEFDMPTEVVYGVSRLTDVRIDLTGNPMNREQRNQATRTRLIHSPGWVQTIKCADMISNTSSIVARDPNFAKVYLREKRDLLDILHVANPDIRAFAYEQVRQA